MTIAGRQRAAAVSAVLYKAYADDGTLLYVGQTSALTERLTHHRTQSSWWSAASTIGVSRPMESSQAISTELAAIATEAPVHNRAGALPEGSSNVARLVAAAGYSGRRFAEVMGFTNSTAQRILRGNRPLTIDEAVRAATALGCDVRDLSTDASAAA